MNRIGILKHRKVFDAWLEGAEIEFRKNDKCNWYFAPNPDFYVGYEYRVKPTIEELKVNGVYHLRKTSAFCHSINGGNTNYKYLNDGITYTYVGRITLKNSGQDINTKFPDERYIFINSSQGYTTYVMFKTDNLDFVVEEIVGNN